MMLEQAKEKKEITIDDLLDYLEILESIGGPAQYLLVQAETFLFMSKEISKLHRVQSQNFNDLLNEMVQDIEDHIYVLENIKSILQNEQNKNKKKHPVFKYQTPDAWITPTISQKHDMQSL